MFDKFYNSIPLAIQFENVEKHIGKKLKLVPIDNCVMTHDEAEKRFKETFDKLAIILSQK